VETPDLRGYEPIEPKGFDWRALGRRLATPFIALAVLLAKFKALIFLVFKLKFIGVALSMLVSIGAYALLWGWKFGVLFVLLLFVHEMGHVLEARRQGLKVSAPMFIPFLGALIALKEMPHNAWREAQMAIAGPILGSLGALALWGIGAHYHSNLLIAAAFTGFFLNLFNLLPVPPLDGGRIVAAVHPAVWILGAVGFVALIVWHPNPLLILFLLIGGGEAWKRWKTRHQMQEYYAVKPWQRVVAGASFLGLAALLVVAMSLTQVPH
jgi:Zn-dependent protease